jgi:hypothetical protein
MAQLEASGRSMLSVLPRREDALRPSALFGSMRYYWSLVLASNQTPPSASTLWMIKRQRLLALEKGLPDYGQSVRPEAHIARQLQMTKDYYYLIGTYELGVGFEKKWHSQVETASRLYYARAGHAPLQAAVSSIGLGLLLAPWLLLAIRPSLMAGAIASVGLVSFALFTARTSRRSGWLPRLLAWPYVLIQELGLLCLSLVKYATRTVSWKGRPVQATPHNREHLTVDE